MAGPPARLTGKTPTWPVTTKILNLKREPESNLDLYQKFRRHMLGKKNRPSGNGKPHPLRQMRLEQNRHDFKPGRHAVVCWLACQAPQRCKPAKAATCFCSVTMWAKRDFKRHPALRIVARSDVGKALPALSLLEPCNVANRKKECCRRFLVGMEPKS